VSRGAPSAVETPVNSGLRLSRQQNHVSEEDINELRHKSMKWMLDYHRKLGELTQIARSVEALA
jgi:hypothetical protein